MNSSLDRSKGVIGKTSLPTASVFALLSTALLVGCAPPSPYEQCVRNATSELQRVENQRNNQQKILSDGYHTVYRDVPVTVQTTCHNEWIGSYSCAKTEMQSQPDYVPISYELEQTKLSDLEKRLKIVRASAQERLKLCEGLPKEVPS